MLLSPIDSFAKANNLSISVCGFENDKKVVYPLRVSQTVVYYCINVTVYTILPLRTLAGWSVVSQATTMVQSIAAGNVYTTTGLQNC